jgi:hypothetical protein
MQTSAQATDCPRCGKSCPSYDVRPIPASFRQLAEGFERMCRDCAWEIATGAGDGRSGDALRLVRESGGWRHYLGGTPVHCGTSLELHVGGDRWMAGRYECALHVERPKPLLVLYVPNERYTRERDRFANEVLENDCPSVTVLGDLALGDDARLRWPERKS